MLKHSPSSSRIAPKIDGLLNRGQQGQSIGLRWETSAAARESRSRRNPGSVPRGPSPLLYWIHALFYGLPLSLLFAASERRIVHRAGSMDP